MKRLLAGFFFAATLMPTLTAQTFPAEDIALFQDSSLVSLKNLNSKKINRMQSPLLKEIAQQMIKNEYPLQQRMRSYRSFLSPYVLAEQLKTSPYSAYENPTGIYFEKDSKAVLWVGDTHGIKTYLVVMDWGPVGKGRQEETFYLKPGYNVVNIENGGNSYIRYFAGSNAAPQQVDVHILTGKWNGYFDLSKHNDHDWQEMLEHAISPVFDVIGQKVQLAYPIKRLKEANGKGVELVQLYDSLISLQHYMMGLVKYNRVPDNHMFGRVSWNGFMFADGVGAGFGDKVLEKLVNPEILRGPSNWGVSHEFGHVNQVRPNMKWVGTTEVTNNLYSVWAQYLYNKEKPKLETERVYDYDGPKIGGRITAFMESAFVHRQPWLTQAGNDRWKRRTPRDWGGDHFVKLTPLWQLQLYFAVAGEGRAWGNPDFYPDLFIQAIDDKKTGEKQSFYQLTFMHHACDVTRLDLTDFFEQVGMLLPVDLWVDDYSCAQMTIKESDVRELKEYASRYKKPETPVLHYITANSVDTYKDKLPLKGVSGKGFERKEKTLIVDNAQWKNAVAFETYAKEKLVKVAFVGAGCTDVKTTTVQLTDETTSVKAVGQDGTRIEVL